MKVPTHIYFFENALSDDVFQMVKQRTVNNDFEKISSEHYPNLFSIFEMMCEETWRGEHENIYAIYTKDDFNTLKNTKLKPIFIWEYNEKFRAMIDEAYALYSFSENLYEGISIALSATDKYWDIKIENFDYRRELDSSHLEQVFDFIGDEKRQILDALDDQLNEFNLIEE